MSCPKCNCSKTIRMGSIKVYECGYYKSYRSRKQGKCSRSKTMKTPSTAQPRVRVFFDKDSNPEEVEVVLSPSSEKSQTFDEFDGIVKVCTDSKGERVHSVHLDCQRLAGRDAHDKLIELLVEVRKKPNTGALAVGRLATRIKECMEIVGEARIDAKIKEEEDTKRMQWGDLYKLLNKALKSPYNNQAKLAAYLVALTPDEKRHRYIDELLHEAMEDYTNGHAMTGNMPAICDNVFFDMSDEVYTKYFDHFLTTDNYNRPIWQRLLNNIYRRPVDTQFAVCEKALRHLVEVDVNDENQADLLAAKTLILQTFEAMGDVLEGPAREAQLAFVQWYAERDKQAGGLADDILAAVDIVAEEDGWDDFDDEFNHDLI